MSFKDRLKNLKLREGFSKKIYKDSLGKDTIGYGHLVKDSEKEKYKDGISEEEASELFKEDVDKHDKSANKLIKKKGMENITDDQKTAIKDMTFQMGSANVGDFKNMLDRLKEGKSEEAAKEAVKSDWYEQTPTRTMDAVNRIMGRDLNERYVYDKGGEVRNKELIKEGIEMPEEAPLPKELQEPANKINRTIEDIDREIEFIYRKYGIQR